MVRLICEHLRPNALISWGGHDLNFSGATLDGGDFRGTVFSGGRVDFSRAHFAGGTTDFSNATFMAGVVDFSAAESRQGR